MSRSRVLLAVLFCAAVLAPISPAQAGSSLICTGYSGCSDKGYSHFGYATHKSTSYWRMYTGTNCTNYVAYRLVTTNGMPNVRPKAGVGNAEDWGFAMSSITNSTPTVGSVAWWGRTGHHVAYVEKVVSSSEIWVSESNWSGAFDWRKITKSGSGWPDGFIHFKDPSITNTTRPAIKGTVKVGEPLTASGGTWSPTGNTYAYQWLSDGTKISGATARTFTPTTAQLGKPLAIRVTATRASYPTVSATSPSTTVGPGSISSVSLPAVGGTPRVDEPVTATTAGRWSPTGNVYTYQWLADGAKIAGATGRTFSPGPELAGQQLAFAVTASRSGYQPVTSVSAPAPATLPGLLANTERPYVVGSPQVGSPLTARVGAWSKPGLSYAYAWSVDGQVVPGADDRTFTPRGQDVGRSVSVEVVASRAGYETARAASAPSASVARGVLSVQTRPTIAGTPRVGSALVAAPGTWSAPAEHTYQWYAGGVAVAGATGRTFIPKAAQRGKTIYVRVTARQAGYTSASAVSTGTAAVAYGRIRFTTQPRITGTLRAGQVVTLDPGVHVPSAATRRYQWLRDGQVLKGFTGSTRRISSGDVGSLISVRVTVSAPGYTTVVVLTAARRAS
ncbi:CHAP domain-containing protein [Aeromicrobium sp. NPDC092404]|uniref:CHAP domain-containing protein n=1 Tax=Aeromicrobium sp. NPDC092404 TaxID=3154976 RepID=UPI00342DFF84